MFELEFNIWVLKLRWKKGMEKAMEKAEVVQPNEPKPVKSKPDPKKVDKDLERDLAYWRALWRGIGHTPSRK
ncbi:MAG: hypothetical protein C0177_04345, partial [Fervidicoccus fontis]